MEDGQANLGKNNEKLPFCGMWVEIALFFRNIKDVNKMWKSFCEK